MEILNKLLRQNNNRWQIIGAVIGSFLGLLLLLLSIQFYKDLQMLTRGEGTSTDQYVIINKKVTLFNTLGVKASFTPEEIESIENQPFIKKVGAFTPNNFKVSASSNLLGFYTELFFESVDDEFVDGADERFAWQTGQRDLPIILSKDYLALYNFGFAPSQGLPQFTATTIQKAPFDITVRGNGMKKLFNGNIVGFSERINSIIVPKSFMEYANKNFPETQPKGSSRIIVLADNPFSDNFGNFLTDNGYELSANRVIGGHVASILKSLITAVAVIGSLIFVLSVLVFILNFQLIVSKSGEDIRLLTQIGYQQKQISDILKKYLTVLFVIIMVLTIAFLFISRYFMVNWFTAQGLDLASGLHPTVYVAALLFAGAFVFINYKNIDKSIATLAA